MKISLVQHRYLCAFVTQVTEFDHQTGQRVTDYEIFAQSSTQEILRNYSTHYSRALLKAQPQDIHTLTHLHLDNRTSTKTWYLKMLNLTNVVSY